MKNIAFISAAAVLAAGTASAATPVSIWAGEHGAYSRIVIEGAGAAAVNLAGRIINIDMETAAAASIDLSEINAARKAHRVVVARKVETMSGSAIRLTLNCDCTVQTNREAGGKLVLDISDAARAVEPEAAPILNERSSDESYLEEARNRMLDLLQRAASDGLITIRDDADDLSPESPAAHASSDASDVAAVQDGASIEKSTTSFEAAAGPCIGDDDFSIDADRFETDPLIAIADLQAKLANPAASRQQEVAFSLAEGYLSIGFGDEALALLTEYGDGDSLRADLARIVAERTLAQSGPLMSARECRGAHALWQAAASEPDAARHSVKRAGEAVNALPRRLRAIIAIRLAKKLIVAGEWDEAEKYYAVASDAMLLPTSDLQFVAAKLLEREGRADEAQRMLLELSTGNTEASKQALLALAERYAAGAKPHTGFIDDIGALAKIDKGAPTGAEAAFREAVAWAESGDIGASILLLRNATGSALGGNGAASEKARRLLISAFESPDSKDRLAALGAYLEHREFVENGDDIAFRRIVASAAIEIGLPNVALSVLGGAREAGDRQAALISAHAALAAEDGDTALAVSAPHAEEPIFTALIVQANLQLGRDHAALAAASALPDGDDRAAMTALAAWRAGEWASAVRAYQKVNPQFMTEKAALQFALAAYMAGETVMPSASEAVLKKDGAAYDGIKAIFAPPRPAPIIERGHLLVEQTSDELRLIEEILSRG